MLAPPRSSPCVPGDVVNECAGAPVLASTTKPSASINRSWSAAETRSSSSTGFVPRSTSPTIATGRINSISQRHGSIPGKTSVSIS